MVIFNKGILLPSSFEKHKICLNCTKSLLIVNWSDIISEINEDFAMEQHFLLNSTLLSTMLQASIRCL